MPGVLSKLTGTLRRMRSRPIVLMYHRIAEEICDPWALAVSPSNFDDQLAMLKRERDVIPLAEFAALLTKGRLPACAVAITFDDGYACNAHAAAPELQKHRLPATFFVTTGMVGLDSEYWWDELARLVVKTQAPARGAIELDHMHIEVNFAVPLVPAEVLREWRWQTPAIHPRLLLYMELWGLIRELPQSGQRTVLDSLWRICGVSSGQHDSPRIMTRDEIRNLNVNELFAIAPHTVTHPALGGIPEELQMQEIVQSRDWCQNLTGQAATMFAYPYGHFTPITEQLVRDAGFSMACSTRKQAVHHGCDLFSVPRLQVLNEPAAWLREKLSHLSIRSSVA